MNRIRKQPMGRGALYRLTASIGSPPHPLDPLPTLRGEGDAPALSSRGSFVLASRLALALGALLAGTAAAAGAQSGVRAAAAPPPLVTAGGGAGGTVCDSSSTLSLIGMDTESGVMLFAASGQAGGEAGWLLQMDAAGREVQAYPGLAAGRFSGSVGPGPVIAVEHCGAECLQPESWRGGGWQPLGEALSVPAGSTVAATYDQSGGPWLVAHAAAGQPGQYQAWSFRYEGRQWKSRGGITVTAVGQPQVLPAPQRRDGVVSGTGLFAASGPPVTWVGGLPGIAANRRGQLLALAGSSVAYVSADGVAYLSADAGKTWRRSTWTPWGDDTTGMWRQGSDYGIDLPLSDHRGTLQLAWFDRRSPADEKVVLTRLGIDGRWAEIGHAPVDITTLSGEHLPITQILVPRRDTWILLSGCAMTSGGPGLVLRSFEMGHVSEARFVPIHAVAPDAAQAPPANPEPPASPASPPSSASP